MSSEVKDLFGPSTAFSITLASLAASSGGAGRQSAVVDNQSTRFGRLFVYARIKQGTSPTSGRSVQLYLLRGDGAGNRDDGGGAADAAITVQNAQLIGVLNNKSSGAASGDVLQGWFAVDNPGREFAVAVVNDTGAALDASGSNHDVRYYGVNPEVQ